MRNLYPRSLFLIPLVLVLAKWGSFVTHVTYYLSGEVSQTIIRQHWGLVAVNIVLFLSFLLFLNVRHRLDWSPAHIGGIGVYAAFIVSLFVEMYGVPLTIFLGSGLIHGGQPPATVMLLQLPGITLAMDFWMVFGALIIILGINLVLIGWWQVYTAEGLVTEGLYAYTRNPQYLGIILIAFGWVVGWPTILTLVLFPILVYAYYRLSKAETDDMVDEYLHEYQEYADQVPLLI